MEVSHALFLGTAAVPLALVPADLWLSFKSARDVRFAGVGGIWG